MERRFKMTLLHVRQQQPKKFITSEIYSAKQE